MKDEFKDSLSYEVRLWLSNSKVWSYRILVESMPDMHKTHSTTIIKEKGKFKVGYFPLL